MKTVTRPVLAGRDNQTAPTTRHSALTYRFDKFDHLSEAPGSAPVSYTYDANGNQTGAGTTTSAYDLADRLVSTTVGTTTETYSYSGDGIRFQRPTGTFGHERGW